MALEPRVLRLSGQSVLQPFLSVDNYLFALVCRCFGSRCLAVLQGRAIFLYEESRQPQGASLNLATGLDLGLGFSSQVYPRHWP